MDFNKINFKSFIPSYERYLDILNSDEEVRKYISFSKYDSKLIFFDYDFVGCFKTMTLDDESNDREIHIAIIKKYRGMGIASFVINKLTDNIFESDNTCESIHLSIDKNNEQSLKMGTKCGYKLNEELTKDNINMGDSNTIVLSKKNPNYITENEKYLK